MRDRYGFIFVDDGASFRQRRAASLARVPPNSRARRLVRRILLCQLPFAAAFLLALLWAIGTAIFE